MSALVECVPNFSEGRDKAKVEVVVNAAKAVAGVAILDVETDADHNRCVLSFVASPAAALEACFAVAKKCRELIDLNHHQGQHPRMGAVDVIPFIPVANISIEECATLADKLGERIGRELEIPVYLYDCAAKIAERKDLANVRKGQFEGLRDLIGKDSSRTPDFGPNRIHPTAGAVAVGARRQIINFNLNLTTHDMAAGKDIAKRVRASGGGLPSVRAKEIDLAARKQVQISTVLTDYKTSSMKKVLDEVTRLAGEHGAKVATAEIVGLLPRESLLDFAMEALNLENFNPQIQILENRLEAVGAGRESVGWHKASMVVSEALSNTDPTPGGGAAAAIAGAMGAGLGVMAMGISRKSKKIDEAKRRILEAIEAAMRSFQTEFDKLAIEDASAFEKFGEAAAIAKEDPRRAQKMQVALLYAAEVPLKTVTAAAKAYATAHCATEAVTSAVSSDLNCCLHLLKAAALCAAENVRINISGLKDATIARDLEARLKVQLGPFA